VHVDDYDYLRPALPVRGEALVEGGNGGELRVRGAKVTTPKEAERIAKLRAEGLRARQTIFRGEGTLHGLHAGEIFTLSGHPRATLDGNYLVTKLHVRGHHTGDLGEEMKALLGREDEPNDVVRVELEALWGAVQFRPELRTQPPRVYSMEGGIIEGDVDSDYAQLDEHGRYLVKFRFDEREGRGSRASARIRMMQPHAGSPEGMHFPLRKGTDVLLAFVGGDPDRPVIAGSVPNALTPSVVHSGNATTNVIRTGGRNLIQIEDQEGAQHIHLRTPHKNTYLHLGAPFNPTYTKATVTDGTSISYTRDISTSVTGTDAQTLVENSRVTVIGRGFISPTDKQGKEVVTLVGKEFLDQTPVDFLLAQIDADVKQAASDMQTLALAVEKLNSAIKAAAAAAATAAAAAAANNMPAPAYTESLDIETDLAAVQSAIKTAVADLTTLQADAEAYQSDAKSDATIAGQWLQDVGVAVSGMTAASTDATNASAATALPDMTAFNTDVTAAFGSAQTALGTDSNFVIIKGQTPPPQLPGKTMAHLPDPSTQPNYIAIKHIPTQTTSMDSTDPPATIDAWIGTQSQLTVDSKGNPLDIPAIETSDATAINSGPTPPLNPGSDVKIVGGDNVTMVANDARSDTGGHAYTLVGRNKTPTAGQTSVVYGGATSTVYSQSKINSSGPDATLATGNTAQSTVVWGDATSHLHGSQTSHIGDNLGNMHSTVIMGSRSVAMTGPMDTYNFAGLMKGSAVLAPAIVDLKIGSMVNFKWALGSIDFEFHSLWTLKNKLNTLHIDNDASLTLKQRVALEVKTQLAPAIEEKIAHIKTVVTEIHNTQIQLHEHITSIHSYSLHVHLGFSIFGPP
jgi:cell division septum initiation protein DivIVA